MYGLVRRDLRPSLLLGALLMCIPVVSADRVFAAKDGAPALGMMDARVNLPGSFENATAARPGQTAAALAAAPRQREIIRAAVIDLQRVLPGLEVKAASFTGGVASVREKRGALTASAPGRGSEDIVREFLSRHGGIYGLSAADLADLVVLGDSKGGSSGLRMLRMEQQIDGRPVFQSETRFLLDRDGRLMKSVGALVPQARARAPQIDPSALISPADAVARLLIASGQAADAGAFTVTANRAGRLELAASHDFVAGAITARQVLFPLGPGLLVPAWSLVVFTAGDQDWYALVDAQTGDLLWRKNIRNSASAHDARFRVYVQADGVTPADNPAPASPNTAVPGEQFAEIAPTTVSMHTAMDAVASADGWINDCPVGGCTLNETQTLGNNVLVCLDRVSPFNACDTDAGGILDGGGRPVGNPDTNTRNRDFLGTTPRDFQTNFLPPPQGGAAGAEAGQTATGAGASGTNAFDFFRRGSTTHLFYISNWYHDKLYNLGFDEDAGNFQQIRNDNVPNAAQDGDRVLGDAQDGAGTNNANFATPPDGTSGRMQMFRFTGPTIDRDGSLDAEIVIHELTHGTSNRLVGNAAGLNWDPARGLGEGWSDFYALSLLNNTNADGTTGRFAIGSYATYKLAGLPFLDNYTYGVRRFPYTTDNSINPMTWADVDDVTNNLSGGTLPGSSVTFNLNGGNQVHNSGEIFALTLWEVRGRVIADPAGANGDVPTGNSTMLQLVTDGLKMTPLDPTFIDGRDAILDADCVTPACPNEDSIWGGFADRGLGYGALAPFAYGVGLSATHVGIHESFSLPFLDVLNPATDVAIDDSATNNNGAIDPGEPVKLTVSLTNPWRGTGKAVASATAILSSSTPGVTIFDASSAYGPIAPSGTAAGDSFTIAVGAAVPCGSVLAFTLTTTSSLGVTAATFQLRVGAASGTDPVITYTGDPNPNLVIPDNRPRGVFHQQTITDDHLIADLNFRADDIPHTFVNDLLIMLRGPNGIGTDMIGLIGLNNADGGSGDNLLNTLIDDDLPFDAAHDMIAAANAGNAPGWPGPWSPVFNSPSWANPAFFGLAGDPTGSLTRFDGLSTKGVWTILAADEVGGDTGSLNSWSILVTPVHFACTSFVGGGAVVTGTKTASGSFNPGGSFSYTVTLTNTGIAGQADNPGDEFTDVLPSGVTLVSASATSGTAVATVLTNTVTWNGSLVPLGPVTITINATIAPCAQTQVISNQGAISYDADNNGTNEASGVTDDPGVVGATDPTNFTVNDLGARCFYAVAPCRIHDTREGAGTPFADDEVRTIQVTGVCGVPAGAKAVALNVTAVEPTGAGYLNPFETGTTEPSPPTVLSFNGGVSRANNAVVTLEATGKLDIRAEVGPAGVVDVVVDVSGWFQ